MSTSLFRLAVRYPKPNWCNGVLTEVVFDVDEATQAEMRILFTLADIDELYVALDLLVAIANSFSARAAPSGKQIYLFRETPS